jgi:hypothetical protein
LPLILSLPKDNGDGRCRNANPRGNPCNKTALKRIRVERGQYVAQMIMRGRAMRKRQEAAQKPDLLLAKPGNVTNRLRPRQNRRQTQKKNLIQGIHHLAALAVIRQTLEMIKKYNSLRKVQSIVHRNPSKTNQRNSTDSALYPFVIRLLHPIALPDCPDGLT